MQAIQIKQTGGPEVLQLTDLPDPMPQSGQALVRLHASGVNFIDTYFREGRYPAQLPYTLGQEGAGTVEALGPDVPADLGLKAGDRVAFSAPVGTYATLACAPADSLVPIPDALSFEEAAACLVQGMTAHYLLHDTYAVQPGDSILIHAGAGGTGLLLIQLAHQMGARIITTVSSPEKAGLARAAGADEVILYTQEDFAAKVEELTHGAKLPVVYDSVGKSTFEGSLKCLRPRGTLVLFGGASGAVPPFDLIRLSTIGSLYVTRPTLKDYIPTRVELLRRARAIFDLVAAGSLSLRIDRIYPLQDAADAHIALQSRQTTGKVLLRM